MSWIRLHLQASSLARDPEVEDIPSLWLRSTQKQHSKNRWSRMDLFLQTGAAPTQNIMFVPLSHWACKSLGQQTENSHQDGWTCVLWAAAAAAGHVDACWRTCRRKLQAQFKNEVAGVTRVCRGRLTNMSTAEKHTVRLCQHFILLSLHWRPGLLQSILARYMK